MYFVSVRNVCFLPFMIQLTNWWLLNIQRFTGFCFGTGPRPDFCCKRRDRGTSFSCNPWIVSKTFGTFQRLFQHTPISHTQSAIPRQRQLEKRNPSKKPFSWRLLGVCSSSVCWNNLWTLEPPWICDIWRLRKFWEDGKPRLMAGNHRFMVGFLKWWVSPTIGFPIKKMAILGCSGVPPF